MSFLTGKKMSTIYKACAKGMENCNQLMIWSKFKDAGYVTAYGEEFLRLPDTFSRYKGFKISPTDHYARPFFLTGETKNGNLICTQKKPSAVQLLDYAVDFVKTYKENFFGMFWLNSFSHNMDNMPALLDSDMVNLFKKINEIGVLSNTFIFFLSDHGIRYGEMRVPLESYYEERLPMLFMWVPSTFRQTNPVEFSNLIINQNRLITPYDVYLSMWEILKLSKNFAEDLFSEACPKCSSLFHEKTYERTCADAGVADKWCSCHNMVKVDQNDVEVEESLKLAISSLQNRTAAIETTLCMTCETLKLKTVLRQHSFESGTNKFYVLAFVMSPGDVAYEALVQKNSEKLKVLEPIDTISAYNTRGNCVKNPNDRAYCVCKKMKKCNKKHKR